MKKKQLQSTLVLMVAVLVMAAGVAASPAQDMGAVSAAAQTIDCGDTYVVRTGDTLREIASLCGVTVDEILELNDFIDNPNLIYAGWVLDMPVEEEPEATQTVQIPVTGGATVSSAFYVVKAGDTLPYISRRLDLSEEEILTANPQLNEEPVLYTGQILLLPDAGDEPAAAVSPRVIEPGQIVTVVASGFEPDSEVMVAGGPLGSEGRVLVTLTTNGDGMLRANIGVPMEAERGNRWTFVVQSVLPADAEEDEEALEARSNLVYVVDTTGPNDAIVYNVRLNDTLSGIAVKFGVSQEEILEANPQIGDASIIYVGQDILIPGPEMREE